MCTLVYRAFQISSSYLNFHAEISHLRKILFNNGFPYKFTDVWVGKVLSKFYTIIGPEKHTANKRDIYFSLPYLGGHSFHIRKKLNSLFNDFYPQVRLRVIFKSSYSIGSFFNIKDKIPDDLRSSIIYQYKCDDCNVSYVGKCIRHKIARVREHLGLSPRTGNHLVRPPNSAIREHREATGHQILKENFSVLASSPNDTELTIMEALYQKQLKPSLGRPSYDLLCF